MLERQFTEGTTSWVADIEAELPALVCPKV
jgi:hypothetical protein